MTKGISKRTKKIVRRRDGDVCGQHLDGCQQKIDDPEDVSFDHLISKSYLKHLPAKKRCGYHNAPWNLQVMHKQCNRDRRGQLKEWPLFHCPCHYLHIDEEGQVFVNVRTESDVESHFLMDNVVHGPDGIEFRIVADKYTDPRGLVRVGFSDSEGSCPTFELGHCVRTIDPAYVKTFNWFERARVGLAQSGLLVAALTSKKYILNPNGNIQTKDLKLIGQFGADQGHRNIFSLSALLISGQFTENLFADEATKYQQPLGFVVEEFPKGSVTKRTIQSAMGLNFGINPTDRSMGNRLLPILTEIVYCEHVELP